MILRSTKFNDVYFSAEDGFLETEHVFLNGNKVAQAWQEEKNFIIAETGFGTGLNFLATWKLFEETAPEDHRLHFISFEKYPLSKSDIKEALSTWDKELELYTERFLFQYPIRVPGPHLVHLTPRVSLTVWFGDIADVLPEWQGFKVDAWFLDGFTPSKNPEMWSDFLYAHMARLSHDKTTFASFTAAGHVRRGLEAAGFEVRKEKGFGRKREMICGRYTSGRKSDVQAEGRSIAIIGGGIAGCSMAYLAAMRGLRVVLYEAADRLAAGGSGSKMGMANPKLTAKPTPQTGFYTAAFAHALRLFKGVDGADVKWQGSLHLCVDDDKDRRFTGYIENLGWHEDHIRRVGTDLFYPDAASLAPSKLCPILAKNVEVRLNTKIESLDEVREDYIFLANADGVKALISDDLPIHSVRGQVSWVKRQPNVNKNICYGGYITPLNNEGFHVLGATFQPWETDCALKDQDHLDNIEKYNQATGSHLVMDDVMGGWAALRAASKDRFPLVGRWRDNIYMSVAHGSHGVVSAPLAADIVLAMITGDPLPVSQEVMNALNPHRFTAKKK